MAQAREAHPARRRGRHVDVEQRLGRQPFDQRRAWPRAARRGPPPPDRRRRASRWRSTARAAACPPSPPRPSGIGHVIAEVGAVIDPGGDQGRSLGQEAQDAQVDAIGRRTVDREPPLGHLLHAHGPVQRQGVPARALLPLGRHHPHLAQVVQSLGQRRQPWRMDAVVIRDENQRHRRRMLPRSESQAESREAVRAGRAPASPDEGHCRDVTPTGHSGGSMSPGLRRSPRRSASKWGGCWNDQGIASRSCANQPGDGGPRERRREGRRVRADQQEPGTDDAPSRRAHSRGGRARETRGG